jgi:hypothetical protein
MGEKDNPMGFRPQREVVDSQKSARVLSSAIHSFYRDKPGKNRILQGNDSSRNCQEIARRAVSQIRKKLAFAICEV